MTANKCFYNNNVLQYYFSMPIDYAQISSTEDQRPTVTTPVLVN